MNEKLNSYYLGELTWVDVENFLKGHDVVIIPIGSTEQHGPHLPLDTDTFDAFWVSLKAAEEAKCALVAPPIYYGVSMHHMDFPGTISITPQLLEELVFQVTSSLIKHGFKKIVLINGHGGNIPALKAAMQRLKERFSDVLIVLDTFDLVSDVVAEVMEVPYDAHAGEIETSTSLVNRGERVRLERIKGRRFEIKAPKLKYLSLGFWSKGPKVSWAFRTKELSEYGVIGDPSKASAEKGKVILERYIRRLAELLTELSQIKGRPQGK